MENLHQSAPLFGAFSFYRSCAGLQLCLQLQMVLAGSMGMLPSASLADGPDARVGLYEPIHGSAPDIAGRNIANPLAAILSIAMMLRYSFQMEQEAQAVEAAVTAVLDAGYRTADIAAAGEESVSTEQMGDLVVQELGRS